MKVDFSPYTEIAGDEVTAEQVDRLARRYYWACDYCRDNDVLEVACGTGQGVGLLAANARSIAAGDFTYHLVDRARQHYGSRFSFEQFDAQQMPFSARAFDVLIMFEAIYYIPNIHRFLTECRRVLRPGGHLLIATANKDLFDFTPSPHSHRYLGVVELETELDRHGFDTTFWGDTPLETVSGRQRVLRPVKAAASRLGLIPKSMAGKKLLKRLVFGGLVAMPPEITAGTTLRVPPAPLSKGAPDRAHKVIYCAAVVRA